MASFTFGNQQRCFSLGPSRAKIVVCDIAGCDLTEWRGKKIWINKFDIEGDKNSKRFVEIQFSHGENRYERMIEPIISCLEQKSYLDVIGIRFPLYQTIWGEFSHTKSKQKNLKIY